MEYALQLTFRKVSTNQTGKSLEFLDVLHIIDNSNKFEFFTTSFIKETATKRFFLSIVFGESIGGNAGDRTRGLTHAKRALYH